MSKRLKMGLGLAGITSTVSLWALTSADPQLDDSSRNNPPPPTSKSVFLAPSSSSTQAGAASMSAAATCEVTTPPNDPKANYEATPAFAEEFDTPMTAVNANPLPAPLDDWVARSGWRSDLKRIEPSQVSIRNGALRIKNENRSSDGYLYGGGITTKQRFKYGYFESRIDFEEGYTQFHQAFWMRGNAVEPLSSGLYGRPVDPLYINMNDPAAPGFNPTAYDTLPRFSGFQDIQPTEYNKYIYNSPNGNGHQISFYGSNNLYYPAGQTSQPRMTQQIDFHSQADNYMILGLEILNDRVRWYENGVYRATFCIPADDQDKITPISVWLSSIPYVSSSWPINPNVPTSETSFSYFRYYRPKSAYSIGREYNYIGNGGFWGGRDRWTAANPSSDIDPTTKNDPMGWINVRDKNIDGVSGQNYDWTAGTLVNDRWSPSRGNAVSLRQGATTPYTNVLRQYLKLLPTGTYTFAAQVICQIGSTSAEDHKLQVKTPNGTYSQSMCQPGANESAWRWVIVDNIQVTDGAATVQIYGKGAANSNVWVDNAAFMLKP